MKKYEKDYNRRAIGCSSPYPRAANDFYSTSPTAINLLHKNNLLDKNTHYWECACGDGSLSKELEKLGYSVYSSDLYDYGFGEANKDFLKQKIKFDGNIITNPPFNKINEFILKGLKLTDKKLYIFGRLQVLESLNRYNNIFKQTPPNLVCPFVKRIKCYKGGDQNIGGSSVTPYAWYIWDNEKQDNTTIIKWLI